MPVSRASFDSIPFPNDVKQTILNTLVGGAPFARSLTRINTDKQAVGWPTAAPTGQAWTAELAALPTITLNDDSYVIGVAKLGGILNLSNESLSDSSFNLSSSVELVLRDTLSADLDGGVLTGGGGNAPTGVVGVATNATAGANFRSAVIGAWGELVAAGANPNAIKCFANPVPIATELARTATGGEPIHPDGDSLAVGPVPLVPVPKLGATTYLVVDTSAVFLVVRNDFTVDLSGDYAFNIDATTLRIKGRFAVAAPTPLKSLRKAVITP